MFIFEPVASLFLKKTSGKKRGKKLHLYNILKFILTTITTRPDTRPSVADGWAGAEMRVFPLFDSMVTDRRTDRRTDRPTDGRTKPLIELRVRN